MTANLESANDIRRFLINELLVDIPISDIGIDQRLATEIGIDSLGFTELVIFIERYFDIRIEEGEMIPENIGTINNIIKFAQNKKNN